MKRPGKSDCAARRSMLRVAVAAALSVSVGAAVSALAQVPAMPSSPQTITIVDVAGNLALTQDAIGAYQKSHSSVLAKVNFTKAPYCPGARLAPLAVNVICAGVIPEAGLTDSQGAVEVAVHET